MTKLQNKTIDVGVGNPTFMQEYWEKLNSVIPGIATACIENSSGMNYDYTQKNELLKKEIIRLHQYVGNVIDPHNFSIVIGNGASQLISAWAHSTDLRHFRIDEPHWPRLKILTEMGSIFSSRESSGVGHLIVCPNNPDNSVQFRNSDSTCTAVDMCYNWPQYITKEELLEVNSAQSNADVLIFGLAKATGHAGTRLGWALAKDPLVAKKMAHYVELSTSGVSTDAQKRGLCVIQTVIDSYCKSLGFKTCFDFGKETLGTRWKTLLESNPKDFTILNKSGMFAWCKWNDIEKDGAAEFSKKYNCVVLSGIQFGASKDFFRISMGCAQDDFIELMWRINGWRGQDA